MQGAEDVLKDKPRLEIVCAFFAKSLTCSGVADEREVSWEATSWALLTTPHTWFANLGICTSAHNLHTIFRVVEVAQTREWRSLKGQGPPS